VATAVVGELAGEISPILRIGDSEGPSENTMSAELRWNTSRQHERHRQHAPRHRRSAGRARWRFGQWSCEEVSGL
jgi:hypothetical protein